MKKTAILVLAALAVVTALTACSKSTADKIDIVQKNDTNDAVDITDIDDDEDRDQILIDYTINYYDMVNDTWNEYSSSEAFIGNADPKFFINKISELMGITIGVNEVTIEGSKLTVDFSATGSPMSSIGSYTESCILNSITDTLFGVYPEINDIHITMDGKEYISGHISLTTDTPYATRKSERLG